MRKNHIQLYFTLAGLILLSACASTGTPGGGPKDVNPPVLLKSIPLQNEVNYSKKRVDIFFDELISLENPSEKIIVSPPQVTIPTTKAIGNKISVLFDDSLKSETTYTIDFTDAIVDYNEKNKFGDFAFSFSTGKTIDSLSISGKVLDASNLNPVPGAVIGVHANLNDSAFQKVPFERISKTSKNGYFSVKGLPASDFHLFALGDKNNDYHFDQPGESIAYYDSIIRPYTEPCTKNDTIWKDSITVDSIKIRKVTCYKPDNLILKYFQEEFGRQYLSKRSRPSRDKIMLTFGYKAEALPELKLLNNPAKDWYLLESNSTKDSLLYWITDTLVTSMDTLKLELRYLKTDSLNRLSPTLDTLSLISRSYKPKAISTKKKEKETPPVIKTILPLALKSDLNATADIFIKPRFEWETPLKEVNEKAWNLYRKVDTTWVKIPFTFQKDSLHLRDYVLKAKWEFGKEYRFDIDSAAVRGIYGKTNDRFSQTFKVREEEEYSELIVLVSGLNGAGFVELLDKSDKVLRREKMSGNKAVFKYIMPGTYYIRAIEDLNDNFRWDTGSYAEKRQPENVYYDPKALGIRVNCTVEEQWNVKEFPLSEQKPKDLLPKTGK